MCSGAASLQLHHLPTCSVLCAWILSLSLLQSSTCSSPFPFFSVLLSSYHLTAPCFLPSRVILSSISVSIRKPPIVLIDALFFIWIPTAFFFCSETQESIFWPLFDDSEQTLSRIWYGKRCHADNLNLCTSHFFYPNITRGTASHNNSQGRASIFSNPRKLIIHLVKHLCRTQILPFCMGFFFFFWAETFSLFA